MILVMVIMTYNNSDNDNHDKSKHLHSIFWSSILLSNRLMIKLKIVEKAMYQSIDLFMIKKFLQT